MNRFGVITPHKFFRFIFIWQENKIWRLDVSYRSQIFSQNLSILIENVYNHISKYTNKQTNRYLHLITRKRSWHIMRQLHHFTNGLRETMKTTG